jgi:hypothetical protein
MHLVNHPTLSNSIDNRRFYLVADTIWNELTAAIAEQFANLDFDRQHALQALYEEMYEQLQSERRTLNAVQWVQRYPYSR